MTLLFRRRAVIGGAECLIGRAARTGDAAAGSQRPCRKVPSRAANQALPSKRPAHRLGNRRPRLGFRSAAGVVAVRCARDVQFAHPRSSADPSLGAAHTRLRKRKRPALLLLGSWPNI